MQVTKTVQFFLDGNGQPDARLWDAPPHLAPHCYRMDIEVPADAAVHLQARAKCVVHDKFGKPTGACEHPTLTVSAGDIQRMTGAASAIADAAERVGNSDAFRTAVDFVQYLNAVSSEIVQTCNQMELDELRGSKDPAPVADAAHPPKGYRLVTEQDYGTLVSLDWMYFDLGASEWRRILSSGYRFGFASCPVAKPEFAP
jgi:hypothetical protein